MTRRRAPSLVDLSPDQPGPKASPFELGGVGRLFVVASNRNQCSFLVDDVPSGPDALCDLERVFPMGYCTLFVLQKVAAIRVDDHGHMTEDHDIPLVLQSQSRYAVLPHPDFVRIGGAFLDFVDADFASVRDQARDRCHTGKCPLVIAVVTDEFSWH